MHLVKDESDLLNRIVHASRAEVFSVSAPHVIRRYEPYLRQRASQSLGTPWSFRLSLLLPWSLAIREATQKEVTCSNPTRSFPISDEVISNLGEFLDLRSALAGSPDPFRLRFECYDSLPFFKYEMVEDAEGRIMPLKNYQCFAKSSMTRPRISPDEDAVVQSHYDDAQRVIEEFGLCVAELTETDEILNFDIRRLDRTTIYRVHERRIVGICPAGFLWPPAGQSMYDVFISYAGANQAQAEELGKCLESKALTTFLSTHGLSPGDNWPEELRSALLHSGQLAVIVSPQSLDSEWVTSEWTSAWFLRRRITPILFQCDQSCLPPRLRQYQHIDFHRINTFAENAARKLGRLGDR